MFRERMAWDFVAPRKICEARAQLVRWCNYLLSRVMFLFASCEITRRILKPTVQKHQGRIVIAPAAQQNCRNPTGRKITEDQIISQHLAVKIRGDIIFKHLYVCFLTSICAPPSPPRLRQVWLVETRPGQLVDFHRKLSISAAMFFTITQGELGVVAPIL